MIDVLETTGDMLEVETANIDDLTNLLTLIFIWYEKKYFYCGTLSFIGFIGFMHCSIFLYAWRAGH